MALVFNDLKRCNQCEEYLPISFFNNDSSIKDGKKGTCRACAKKKPRKRKCEIDTRIMSKAEKIFLLGAA